MLKDQDIICCHSACNSDSQLFVDLYRGGVILSPGTGTAWKKITWAMTRKWHNPNQTLSLKHILWNNLIYYKDFTEGGYALLSSRCTFLAYVLYLYPLRNSMDPVSKVSGSRLFTYAQYQLAKWQIMLTWMQYGRCLCSQLRPQAEEICWIRLTFKNYDLSSMLATKIHDLSSKTATSKLTCWQKQPFFIYLSSLMGSSNFIKSNCGFKFGRNVAEW